MLTMPNTHEQVHNAVSYNTYGLIIVFLQYITIVEIETSTELQMYQTATEKIIQISVGNFWYRKRIPFRNWNNLILLLLNKAISIIYYTNNTWVKIFICRDNLKQQNFSL